MSCTIVLGCYRSGSSVVAGILHHLGVTMGKSFDEPTKNNIQGYWEDLEFKNLHKQIRENPEREEVYKNLIVSREQKFQHWGLKDPLLCTFLPKFVSYLNTDYRLIVCRRDPTDIGNSIVKALGLGVEYSDLAYALAVKYIEEMDEALETYTGPTLEIFHHDLLAFPKVNVERIANFVGLPVNEAAINSVKI